MMTLHHSLASNHPIQPNQHTHKHEADKISQKGYMPPFKSVVSWPMMSCKSAIRKRHPQLTLCS